MISAAASSRALLQRGSLLLHPAARACVVGGSSAAAAASVASESRRGVATSAASAASVPQSSLGAGSSWSSSSSGASSPFLAGAAAAAAAAAAALAATGAAAAAHAEAPAAPPPPQAGGSGEYVLYQYTVCPFCCKTKAVMDYYNVPYRTVEVNPLTKSEIKWSDYKKVPVLVMDGQQFNDSNVISEEIKAKFASEDNAKSGGNWFSRMLKGQAAAAEEQDEEEAKWRKWVDEWFVRVITTNIYRTWGESVGTFDYISEHALDFGLVERLSSRYVGATAMYYIAKNMKKKYSIEGDDRTHLYTAVGDFLEAVGDRDFMGGDKPELSDLYVFGVLRAVQGTETFKDVMANTDIQDWYVRMTDAVGDSVAAPSAAAAA